MEESDNLKEENTSDKVENKVTWKKIYNQFEVLMVLVLLILMTAGGLEINNNRRIENILWLFVKVEIITTIIWVLGILLNIGIKIFSISSKKE